MTADPDNDGLTNLMEYALTSNPNVESRSDLPIGRIEFIEVGGVTAPYLTISFRRQLAASDLTYTVEISGNLEAWDPSSAVLISSSNNGDGTANDVWRALTSIDTDPSQFARLRVNN
jgi:hypothetical protein